MYKFEDKKHIKLGPIIIHLLESDILFAEIKADVVNVDVPLLLELDSFTQFKALFDFGWNTVTSKYDEWTFPLVWKLGHLFITWTPAILNIE